MANGLATPKNTKNSIILNDDIKASSDKNKRYVKAPNTARNLAPVQPKYFGFNQQQVKKRLKSKYQATVNSNTAS